MCRACSILLHDAWWCICHAIAFPQAFILRRWKRLSCYFAALPILLIPAICRPGLVRDIVQCCRLARAPAAVDAALQCVIQMTASAALQVTHLLRPLACIVLLDKPAPQALPAVSRCSCRH